MKLDAEELAEFLKKILIVMEVSSFWEDKNEHSVSGGNQMLVFYCVVV